MGFVPFIVWAITKLLLHFEILSVDLTTGMVVAASLPMTVNMVIVMTKSSGGDEACALINASMGNLLGVFVTPALLLLFLGQDSDIEFGEVVLKLCYRVLVPICFGQIL